MSFFSVSLPIPIARDFSWINGDRLLADKSIVSAEKELILPGGTLFSLRENLPGHRLSRVLYPTPPELIGTLP